MNHYQLLGIAKDATAEEVRKAYRKTVAALHPDRFANAVESAEASDERNRRFAEARDAYETLSDSRKRYLYDRRNQVPQGLGDLLATPRGMRAMGRLLPRAPRQARDGEDLVTVVRVAPSTLANGGGIGPPDAFPPGFDPLFLPADVRKVPLGRLPEQGTKGENGGADGDLFVLVVPITP